MIRYNLSTDAFAIVDTSGVYCRYDQAQAAITAAVLEEREACAVTAWRVGMESHMKLTPDTREIGSKIATDIRAREVL